MSHIHRKRDYESFSRPKRNLSKGECRDPWTVESVRIVNEDIRIHGPLIWSIFKGDEGVHGPPIWSILKEG